MGMSAQSIFIDRGINKKIGSIHPDCPLGCTVEVTEGEE